MYVNQTSDILRSLAVLFHSQIADVHKPCRFVISICYVSNMSGADLPNNAELERWAIETAIMESLQHVSSAPAPQTQQPVMKGEKREHIDEGDTNKPTSKRRVADAGTGIV